MNDYKIKSWLGQTIPMTVEWDSEITADATILIYDKGSVVFEKTGAFQDNISTIDITPDESEQIGAGKYYYLIKIEHASGEVDIIPQGSNCDYCPGEECAAPEFEICEVGA